MEELVGTWANTRRAGEDWVLGRLRSGETLIGSAKSDMLVPGLTYRFFGHWSHHPQYGKQFKFQHVGTQEPHTKQEVILYLQRMLGKSKLGFGRMKCEMLWSMYGQDAVEKLRNSPLDVAKETSTKPESCVAASRILTQAIKCEHTMMDLLALFEGRSVHKDAYEEIIDKLGSSAVSRIKANPYWLLLNRIPGFGFAKTDSLYLDLGHNPAALKRQTLCLLNQIRTSWGGDTWFKAEDCIEQLHKDIASTEVKPERAITLGVRSRILSVCEREETRWLADGGNAASEDNCASITAAMASGRGDWPDVDGLSEHQNQEYKKATAARIGILAGTPGTGKTYTAAMIVRALLESNSAKDHVAVCTPTGKAAVRVNEAMASHGIKLRARTTHSLLGVQSSGGGSSWRFVHGKKYPLPHRFVIADEGSMDDTSLLSSLMSALSPSAHLLLVGDPYQLPPVGHGAPLRDLIKKGIPCGELSEIRRNSGLIVESCALIRNGGFPKYAEGELDDQNNLRLYQAGSQAKQVQVTTKIIQSIISKGEYDPINEFQVITPKNSGSAVARKELNPRVQDLVNPDSRQIEKTPYRINDKIICLENGEYASCESENATEYIANGEIGQVVDSEKAEKKGTRIIVRFASAGDGERYISLLVGTKQYHAFDLGYVITCHKSQGSEWPIVVIMADQTGRLIGSREWIYTAISRAKKRCLIVGGAETVKDYCRRPVAHKRKTFLVERIKDYERMDSESLCGSA